MNLFDDITISNARKFNYFNYGSKNTNNTSKRTNKDHTSVTHSNESPLNDFKNNLISKIFFIYLKLT